MWKGAETLQLWRWTVGAGIPALLLARFVALDTLFNFVWPQFSIQRIKYVSTCKPLRRENIYQCIINVSFYCFPPYEEIPQANMKLGGMALGLLVCPFFCGSRLRPCGCPIVLGF